MSLTERAEHRSPELEVRARGAGVALAYARWQELAQATADPFEAGDAGDFVRMLIEEGIVVPKAIRGEDWTTWNSGAEVLRRIKLLLTEARPEMTRAFPGLVAGSRWGADDRWIYSGYSSERLEIGVGLSANESARRPDSAPIIWTYLRNRQLSDEENRERARAACRALEGATQPWSGLPSLARPAAEIVTGQDFREQVRQVVAFAFWVALEFQRVGYLPADLPLVPPDRDASPARTPAR